MRSVRVRIFAILREFHPGMELYVSAGSHRIPLVLGRDLLLWLADGLKGTQWFDYTNEHKKEFSAVRQFFSAYFSICLRIPPDSAIVRMTVPSVLIPIWLLAQGRRQIDR